MVRTLDLNRRSHKAEALTQKFALRIVGQQDATDALLATLEKYQSGFYDKTKPIASLLFLGPTGVGKTGTAEAFAEGLFGKPTHMMKIDCAEFQHSYEIAKLLGSPPGYLGHRETHPFFTNDAVERLRQTPESFKALLALRKAYDGASVVPTYRDPAFTIVMFDEIEKASDALWNLLLGILDKGELTNGLNELVDFKNTVIIMTSNVGSSELATENAIGYQSKGEGKSEAKMKEIALGAARRKFMPEFLNRLDHIVMFKTLTPEDLDTVLTLELDKLWDRVVMQSPVVFHFDVSPAAQKQLLKEGYDRRYNARNLKRTIEKYVALPLSRLVATGQINSMDNVIVDYVGDWRYYAQATLKSDIPEG